MNNIALIIKKLMKIHELTQVDFAVKSEIPLPTVRKYLRSEFNPTEKNIEKIEKNFKIKLTELLKIDLRNLDKLENTYSYFENLSFKTALELEKEEKKDFITEDKFLKRKIQYFENTIILISEFIKDVPIKTKINIKDVHKAIWDACDITYENDIKTTDIKIIELLKTNNIDINFDNDIFTVKIDNTEYEIEKEKFLIILEELKKGLYNNFKSYIELLKTK